MKIKNLTLMPVLFLMLLMAAGCGGDGGGGTGEDTPAQAGGTYNNGCLLNGMQLPAAGIGYYHDWGGDDFGYDNWGTAELIELIQKAGEEWDRWYPYPDWPRIGILDMSLREGGHFSGHYSHQNGLDVDVRYVRADNEEKPITTDDTNYDQDRSGELMEIFIEGGANVIYSGDKVLSERITGVYYTYGQHKNHFHVRLPSPDPIVPCPE